MKKIYPAIFTRDGKHVSVQFLDVDAFTYGNTFEEAFINAKEALELSLFEYREEDRVYPTPSKFEQINIVDDKTQHIQYIEVNMAIVEAEMLNQSVKKTLTIPRWLDLELKEHRNLNLSGILQSSLKELLGVDEPSIIKQVKK